MLIVVILVFLATEIPLMVITVLHTLHQRLGTGVPCHRETTHGHHCPPHPAPDSSNLFLITEIPLMVITVLHTLHQRYSKVFLITEIPLMVITVLHNLHQRYSRWCSSSQRFRSWPSLSSTLYTRGTVQVFLATGIPLMVITVLHTLHQRYSTVVPCHRDTTHFFRCTYCSIPFIIYNTLQQLQLPLHGLREGPGHHPHSERAALLQLPPQLCHLLRHEQV